MERAKTDLLRQLIAKPGDLPTSTRPRAPATTGLHLKGSTLQKRRRDAISIRSGFLPGAVSATGLLAPTYPFRWLRLEVVPRPDHQKNRENFRSHRFVGSRHRNQSQ